MLLVQTPALTYMQIHRNDDDFNFISYITDRVVTFDTVKELNQVYHVFPVIARQGRNYLVKVTVADFEVKNPVDISIDNCGSSVKATHTIVVVSCPTYADGRGKVSIFRASDLQLIKEIEGERQYGSEYGY